MTKVTVTFELPVELDHDEEHAFLDLVVDACLRRRLLGKGGEVSLECDYGVILPPAVMVELPILESTIMGGPN